MSAIGQVRVGVVGAFLLAAASGCSGPVPCASAADCMGLPATPDCDRIAGYCTEPCTRHSRSSFACVDGERQYCDDGEDLPCTACPDVCAESLICHVATARCRRPQPPGELCSNGVECASGLCTMGGLCSAAHGEACTPETCFGFCAETNSGGTMCLQSCTPGSSFLACPDGADVECVTLEDERAYCVPLCGDCFEECSIGLCDTGCSPTRCVDFCAPDELNPTNFCRM